MAGISITPIILCGGAGSRLWPMSRDDMPKQFHALFNNKTLLANTVERTKVGTYEGIIFNQAVILGSQNLEQLLKEAADGMDGLVSTLILEPSIRDTAAAIAAVTAYLGKKDPNNLLLVLPSDARIDDHEELRRTIAKAARTAADTDAIMTLGIKPTRPETQYGYIEQGSPLGGGYAVTRFREKPDFETAQEYLASGKFLWNAGMFLYRAGRMISEFEKHQPEIWKNAKAAADNAEIEGNKVVLNRDAFNAAPKLSIDYAIMEKADNIGVVPAYFDWDDMGSWMQLYEAASKDEDGNAVSGDAIIVEAHDNFVRSDGPLVALAGIDGVSVIAEDNKVLIVPTNKAHLVKDVTASFKTEFAIARPQGSKQAIKAWLFDQALPLWSTNGMDYENGGAHEALNFDGSVALHASKRLRVTARQIYTYSHASLLGWDADLSDKVLRHCFDTLINTGWHEEGGFIHLYNPDGTVQNPTRDTYDQCFVLLGLAWLFKAKNWPEARQWGDKTLQYMDDRLFDPIHGGFFDSEAKSGLRRANPHMHFLEAMLAWYEATGESHFLDRAEKMVELFLAHFFDPETGTVTERFNADWSPIEDADADHLVEPGHHYEWAWLLMRFNGHRELAGLSAKARTIYASAHAFGHHEKTGAAADTMAADGHWVSPNARCWPQTEALKAAIIFEKNGLKSATHMRTQMLDVLFNHYLTGPIDGGWFDAINQNGKVTAPDMPSSTFYHVFCALVEHLEND